MKKYLIDLICFKGGSPVEFWSSLWNLMITVRLWLSLASPKWVPSHKKVTKSHSKPFHSQESYHLKPYYEIHSSFQDRHYDYLSPNLCCPIFGCLRCYHPRISNSLCFSSWFETLWLSNLVEPGEASQDSLTLWKDLNPWNWHDLLCFQRTSSDWKEN